MQISGNAKVYLTGVILCVTVVIVTLNLSPPLYLKQTFQPVLERIQPVRRRFQTVGAERETPAYSGIDVYPGGNRSVLSKCETCIQEGKDDMVAVDLEFKRRLPKVIGIGVKKCGTSALSFFLEDHPFLVHSKPQEVFYWNKHKNESLDWYRDKMPFSFRHEITMEKTPSYIFDLTIPTRIKAVMPDTKFIVIIRDPVVRAVSDYLHLQGIGWPEFFKPRVAAPGKEPFCYLNTTFEGSVVWPNGEVNSDNAILVNGAYVIYLREWLTVFPRKHFLVIDGDAFIKNPLPTLQKIEEFLGLPKFFDEESVYFDDKKGFFCKAKPVKRCASKFKGIPHPEVDDDVIMKLRDYYRPYNAELERLLGQTFTWTRLE
ncbi:heparan sulfate glucosamine 3-O-sulfotransferase 1-like [Diadema antillarum]|uniref:heparan sulfate glucosamine 3-O-sulfotransferase 1-like n=1 Tax=Diadema antillarum TaxID=105358 RepID=UPI003A87DE41